MTAIEVLTHEHRVIEQVLACLERIGGLGAANGRLDHADARQAIDFFLNFADRCHHGKEENHLFPLLEAQGVVREHGPIGQMLHEHDEGRRCLRAMADAVEADEAGEPEALERFLENARDYVRLMREHLGKEDHHLFPLANRILSDWDRLRLRESFTEAENQEVRPGAHQKYLSLADELADRWHVPKAGREVVRGRGYGWVPSCVP